MSKKGGNNIIAPSEKRKEEACLEINQRYYQLITVSTGL